MSAPTTSLSSDATFMKGKFTSPHPLVLSVLCSNNSCASLPCFEKSLQHMDLFESELVYYTFANSDPKNNLTNFFSDDGVRITTIGVRELSDLLKTNLDSETIRILVDLCELGVDPEVLAQVVVDLKEDKAKRNSVHHVVTGTFAKDKPTSS